MSVWVELLQVVMLSTYPCMTLAVEWDAKHNDFNFVGKISQNKNSLERDYSKPKGIQYYAFLIL